MLEDNRHLAQRQRAAIAVCDENRDTATSTRLQEILDETEKRIWFLYEMTQGAMPSVRTQPQRHAA